MMGLANEMLLRLLDLWAEWGMVLGMNEQPEFDRSDIVLVCMKDGKFLAEESDGHATWMNWVDSPINAKVFAPLIVYGEMSDWTKRNLEGPLDKSPSYFQKWPKIPDGAKMVRLKLVITGWLLAQGPEESRATYNANYSQS